MGKGKIILSVLGGLAAIIVLTFVLELFGLGMFKFFEPKRENIRREVFENTKSYLHGIQQDLGKYHLEYQKANTDDRAAIKSTIRMRFAEVDVAKLQSPQLRTFLTNMRGY
jgi:hypothetical protein